MVILPSQGMSQSITRMNPAQSPRSEPKTITNLRWTILAALSHLGGGKHQQKQLNPTVKHEHKVPLDAITQAMHLDSLPISQG